MDEDSGVSALRICWCSSWHWWHATGEEYMQCTNPEVRWLRVTKEKRAAGVLDNFKESEKYAEHCLRKYVRNRTTQIMPSINCFFSDPDLPTN